MWPLCKRSRSWKSYLGVCCALLAAVYLTFQGLAWFVIGPEDEYQLSNDVVRAMERVTSGINLDAAAEGDHHVVAGPSEPVAHDGDVPAPRAHADSVVRRAPGGKSSALLSRFGSRKGLLAAMRSAMYGRKIKRSPAAMAGPEMEPVKKRKRNGVINRELMKKAKERVALRRRKQVAVERAAPQLNRAPRKPVESDGSRRRDQGTAGASERREKAPVKPVLPDVAAGSRNDPSRAGASKLPHQDSQGLGQQKKDLRQAAVAAGVHSQSTNQRQRQPIQHPAKAVAKHSPSLHSPVERGPRKREPTAVQPPHHADEPRRGNLRQNSPVKQGLRNGPHQGNADAQRKSNDNNKLMHKYPSTRSVLHTGKGLKELSAGDHLPANTQPPKQQHQQPAQAMTSIHKARPQQAKSKTAHGAPAGTHQAGRHGAASHPSSRFRGVEPSKRRLYDLEAPALFHCLDGKGEGIPLDRINDDYCDCGGDGSDEPGTSACSNGRFYCLPEKKYVFSSHVDDGRCDCCDGSDESQQPTRQPCQRSCADLVRLESKSRERVVQALAVRKQYVEQSRDASPAGLYGADNAFWPLREKCFEKKQGEYMYDVCPYSQAVQKKLDQNTMIGMRSQWTTVHTLPTIVMLGDTSALLRPTSGGKSSKSGGPEGGGKEGYAVLRMDGGLQCPSGAHRALQIAFECDVTEELRAIGETETCLYTALISTPAACTPPLT